MSALRLIRWRLGIAIAILGVSSFMVIRAIDVWPYEQSRTIAQLGAVVGTVFLLLLWWMFFSRAPLRLRLGVLACCALLPLLFKYRGMTGDFRPLFAFRFAKNAAPALAGGRSSLGAARPDFPQLLGPNRDARIDATKLDPDWKSRPPQLLWRQPVGPAWSGFAIVGDRAVTLEQHGEEEWATCYHIDTGALLWKTAHPGRYNTSIAGEGPRTVPTFADHHVHILGAVGTLRCLAPDTGAILWSRELTRDAGVEIPQWGFASSPLVHEGKVIVSAGGADGRSLLAYDAATGEPAWKAGSRPINYSSPFLISVAGRQQIVMFNSEAITAHDPATGATLWEHPWGKGFPVVARPIPVSGNRILFSSGYGVGSALLEIASGTDGKLTASEVWKTPRFQAKFSNPAERDGYVYGVSDGIFACLDLKDGKVKWKDGRHGHGQGLLVGEHYLQMTELPGDIVLLRPTPEGANELARFHIFDAKTWNPIALSGDLLLVRNDSEAACIRLPLKE